MTEKNKIKPISHFNSLAIFLSASIILYLETSFLIPYLHEVTGWETILFWFIVAGLGMFLPLIILADIMLKKEGFSLNKNTWENRLRFRKMSKEDLVWTFIGLIIIGTLSFVLMKAISLIFGEFSHQPPFMSFPPLGTDRLWILLVWLPYWILNIMGEEIIWRGVLLPRQAKTSQKFGWLFNGLFWGIFHFAFGWQLFITLIPMLMILPCIVHKRKNSWIGVIIHAGLNGPSFIAIALGLL